MVWFPPVSHTFASFDTSAIMVAQADLVEGVARVGPRPDTIDPEDG